MVPAIWIVALAAAMGISLRSLRWGVMLYPVFALVFPVLGIGDAAVRFELVYCLWLIFLIFVHKAAQNGRFKWHTILSLYTLFLIVVTISTTLALSSKRAEGSVFQILVQFYGIFRPLLVMFLFINVPATHKDVRWLLSAFIWLSIPIALLSIGQTLGVGIAQEITLHAYTSPWRSPVFRLLEERGGILRATGVFESPVFNAVYLLIVLVTSAYLFIRSKQSTWQRFTLYLSFGLVLVAGITTLSATFLLGIAVTTLLLCAFLWIKYPRRFLRFTMTIVSLAIILSFLAIPKLLENPLIAGSLRYQTERILQGEALKTRYDPSGGILATTYQAIAERPILGWGITEVEGAFVGDSAYISLLYKTGILGLALWLSLIFFILYSTWRFRKIRDLYGNINWLVFLYTLLLLAVGVSAPSFYILRLQEWYWALVGLSLNPYLRHNKDWTH